MSTLKRTPLFAAHQRLGGKLIEFGGWEMPVQYSSIMDEHLAVRKASGVFDIAHMGEVLITGPGAVDFLNRTLTNDIRKLAVGQAHYTQMCNERGGVIDDLYVYRLEEERYLAIINASRIEADWDWLQTQYDQAPPGHPFDLANVSDELSAIAIQGPRVIEFINQVIRGGSIGGTFVSQATDLKKNQVGVFVFEGTSVYVARTGYTGEDGFEVVAPNAVIEAIWNQTLAAGHVGCCQPCGLGARDTLRTEACLPLYGHELDENTTPLEAGLGVFVSLDKGDFIGRAVLAQQKAAGVTRRCVAFKLTEKGAPPRPHYPIWSTGPDAAKIGEVASGTQSPSLGIGIGLGYVPTSLAAPGTPIMIEVRGRQSPAVVVKKPLWQKAG